MQYEITEKKLRVVLPKELDHHNCMEIKDFIDKVILEGRADDIIFDFRDTEFMDSSGIGVIIGRYKLVNSYGGRIYTENETWNIKRIIRVSGLDKILKPYEKEDGEGK